MDNLQQFEREDIIARQYEYEDYTVLAADFGAGTTDGVVDVVDGTAILAIDGDEFDLALPEGETRAFMKNGVVTIEVEE